MATILKMPTERSVGVMVITTPERDHQIAPSAELRAAIESLKSRWLIGLHHNWHDHSFRYDPLFDFSMAGEDDLREASGRDVPLLPMDACNFVPSAFHPSSCEKFWDVLYVARAVMFKRIPEFFRCIRQLYDAGQHVRVLFICPVPPGEPKDRKTVFYDIREVYDRMFSEQEKDLFNLLTIEYRYPFPFDLDTLAHFYRSSKVFVHTADDERRCRVAGYAWACGLPVVGMECVGSLLPSEARKAPYLFKAKTDRQFALQIQSALAENRAEDWDIALMRRTFTETESTEVLNEALGQMAGRHGKIWNGEGLSRSNLSIRLGRHHTGVDSPNGLKTDLLRLVRWLGENEAQLKDHLQQPDPERSIDAAIGKGLFMRLQSLVTRFA